MLSGHRLPRSTRHRRVQVPLVGVTDRNGRVVGLAGSLRSSEISTPSQITPAKTAVRGRPGRKPAERRVYRRAPGDDRDGRQVPLPGAGSAADGVRMTPRTWPNSSERLRRRSTGRRWRNSRPSTPPISTPFRHCPTASARCCWWSHTTEPSPYHFGATRSIRVVDAGRRTLTVALGYMSSGVVAVTLLLHLPAAIDD